MKRTLILMLTGILPFSANAMEASASGSTQAAQAAVSSMNATTNASIAVLQTEISGTIACNAQRKFYAPADPKKDANGCVGIQDYQLSMNSTNGINTTNAQINSSISAANAWAGNFINTDTNGYGLTASAANGIGLYGTSTNGNGVYGASTNSNGVYGQSSNGAGLSGNSTNNVGVYAQSSANWSAYFVGGGANGIYSQTNGGNPSGGSGGEFNGGAGVWIGNSNSSAQLCLNGSS